MTVIRANRGDDLQFRVTWKASGVPINLTGYTILLTVSINGTDSLYTTTPVLTVTPLSGQIDVLIEDAVTETWGSSGTIKLKVTSGSDIVTTLLRGRLLVR